MAGIEGNCGGHEELTIRIGERLDISSNGIIQRALRCLRTNPVGKVVVDLGATQHVHDSGVALLMILQQQTSTLKNQIYLVNCRPELQERLRGLTVEWRFYFE